MNNQKVQEEADTSLSKDVRVALCFLSRLPVKPPQGPFNLAHASRAFGLAGLILGAISGLAFVMASLIGLGTTAAVIIALAIGTLATGGLHEDGLADVADGFGGGWDRSRKLEIMRDSQIGTYGVLALIFSVGFRIVAYAGLLGTDRGALEAVAIFAAIGCLSRAPMAMMMYQMPVARKDGRAVEAGSPSHDNLRTGLFVSAIAGGVILFFPAGVSGVAMTVAGMAFAYLVVARTAEKNIGGYTGDVLGTLQQITEIFCLIALLAINFQ